MVAKTQLADAGITGPSSFDGAEPDQWQRLADAKLSNAWRKAVGVPTAPLSKGGATALERYVLKGINDEIAGIEAALPGSQEGAVNNAGLKIHSLLKGAELRGMEPSAHSVLKAEVAQRFRGAVVAMPAGDKANPWTVDHATEKWDRTEEAAEPRNLFSILGVGSAAEDFADFEVAEAGNGDRATLLQFLGNHTFRREEEVDDIAGVRLRGVTGLRDCLDELHLVHMPLLEFDCGTDRGPGGPDLR